MYRTRGKVFGVVAAIAVSGLLAACGDNDSTATSTPTLSSAATSAPQSASSIPEAPAPEGEATGAPEGEPAPEPPAEPERPAPLPPQEVPAPEGGPVGDKEQKFLDELGKQGVTPSSPDIALSIGNYVCQGLAQGVSEESMSTFVNAMAGSDPSFDPAKMPVEQAGQIYIDTAEQHYCQ